MLKSNIKTIRIGIILGIIGSSTYLNNGFSMENSNIIINEQNNNIRSNEINDKSNTNLNILKNDTNNYKQKYNTINRNISLPLNSSNKSSSENNLVSKNTNNTNYTNVNEHNSITHFSIDKQKDNPQEVLHKWLLEKYSNDAKGHDSLQSFSENIIAQLLSKVNHLQYSITKLKDKIQKEKFQHAEELRNKTAEIDSKTAEIDSKTVEINQCKLVAELQLQGAVAKEKDIANREIAKINKELNDIKKDYNVLLDFTHKSLETIQSEFASCYRLCEEAMTCNDSNDSEELRNKIYNAIDFSYNILDRYEQLVNRTIEEKENKSTIYTQNERGCRLFTVRV